MFFTIDSLFLNFGRLALPNEAENNLINSVYEGFRYGSKELQYMSLDKPNVLTILILPIKLSFLFFQLLSVFSKEQTFSSKLRVLACFKS